MFGWLVQFHASAIRTAGLEDLVLSEHSAIVDHIEARNPDKAMRVLSDHLHRASKLYHRETTFRLRLRSNDIFQ